MDSNGSSKGLMTKNTLDSQGCTNISDLSRCHFDKGLVFIKQRDIILTTDTWTIAVTVGTEDYDDILFQVSNLFKYLKGLETSSNSTDIKFLIPSFELIHFCLLYTSRCV